MELVKSSLHVFITRIFRLSFSFITGLVLARWLQPEGRGAYSLITQFHLITVAIGGMSIGHATIHFSGSGRYSTSEQVSNTVFSCAIFSFVTCATVLFFRESISKILPLNSNILFILLTVIPLSIFDTNFRSVLQSKYKFSSVNMLEMLQAITLGILIFLFSMTLKPSLEKVLYAWLLSIIVSFITLTWILTQTSTITIKLNWPIFFDHLSFGVKAHLSTVIGLLSLRFDQYILSYMTDKASVGKYAVAVSLAELIWFLPASVSFVMLPRTAHADEKDSAKSIVKACWYVIGISIIAACILALVSVPLIDHGYGKSYHDSLMALWLLLPGMVAMSVTTVTTPYFLGKLGKPQLGAIVAAVSLLSNIILNLFLIPIYKINGAALASTISYLLASAVNLYLFNKYKTR